jgi:hypothetical protein
MSNFMPLPEDQPLADAFIASTIEALGSNAYHFLTYRSAAWLSGLGPESKDALADALAEANGGVTVLANPAKQGVFYPARTDVVSTLVGPVSFPPPPFVTDPAIRFDVYEAAGVEGPVEEPLGGHDIAA